MKKTIFCGLIILTIMLVMAVTVARAQEEAFSIGDVAIIKIGEKLSNTSEVRVTPLYAIRIGDTTVAEMEMALWQKVFGSYARNAIFYTRLENGNGNWKATGYRRPMTREESEKFFENPLYFYAERILTDELPLFLGNLNPKEISQISFVMEYLRGGIQVYPIDNTSLEDIIVLAKKIFFLTRPKIEI